MKSRYVITAVVDHGAGEPPARIRDDLIFALTGTPLDSRRSLTGPRVERVENVDRLGEVE